MAENRNTKEKIMETALALFSENGYDGTALQDIADALGITKTALYRHYKSKDDIWNQMLDRLDARYVHRFHTVFAKAVPATGEELLQLSLKQIDFTLHDKKTVQARKLLTVEQFRNPRAAALATERFIGGPEEKYAALFAEMARNGILRQGNFSLLATEYIAPVGLFIQLCDREPEREQEAIARITAHIQHFIAQYFICEKEGN